MPLFADLLGRHVQRTHTSVNRLAKLSGIPQRTIANWLSGSITKPQQWQGIVKVAGALHLGITETNALLRSAGHPMLSELGRGNWGVEDLRLLSGFQRSAAAPQVPFQLISDLPGFAGRTAEIRKIKQHLHKNKQATLIGVRGMGGVGKTSLVVHLAYQICDEYTDGVLWARLDTSDSLTILDGFASAYGMDVSRFKDVESRATAVRGLLAKKRVLIILDNAITSLQIQPLIPPSTANCTLIITTRHDLSILDGWPQLSLTPFKARSGEAFKLFENHIGRKFVNRQRKSLGKIADALGYLPLALSIAARRLHLNLSDSTADQEEAVVVREFLAALQSSHKRLDVLSRDDISVRTSFGISFEALTGRQKELFSTLGMFSAEDFGVEAVAYLLGWSNSGTEQEIRNLNALSLVEESRKGRWRLHPLIRDYAREELQSMGRLPDLVKTMLQMYRQAAGGRFVFQNSLDSELLNIRYAFDQAVGMKMNQPIVETAIAITPDLSIGAWFSFAQDLLSQALEAARQNDDPKARLDLLKGLAGMQMGLGENREGGGNLHLALQIARKADMQEEIADILCTIGKLKNDTGFRKQANHYFEESLSIAKKIKAYYIVGRNLNNLALNLAWQAQFKEAETLFIEALNLFREHNFEDAVFIVQMNLGDLYETLGDLDRAESFLREALHTAAHRNHRTAIVGIRTNLARIMGARSAWAEAETMLNEAIQLAIEIHSLRGEGIARCELGELWMKQGKFRKAANQFILGVEASTRAGDIERRSVALNFLGQVHLETLDLQKAEQALDAALDSAGEIQNEMILADVYFSKGRVCLARRDEVNAIKFTAKSMRIYRRLGESKRVGRLREWIKANLQPVQGRVKKSK
jgi:tetratricopeptide (TPR) repeat protein